MNKFTSKLLSILGSNKFFYFLLGFFVFQAAWIALSAVYPMAFDEDFHFGIIQLFSHQLLPFFSHQPPGSSTFGELTRDPSLMYHYLMSFPYRFIAIFIHDADTQITILRFINIGFFTSSLVLFRKIFLKVKASPALTNITILFFILTPITSLLAAQINYDNLLILLTAGVILLSIKLVEKIKIDPVFPLSTLINLLVLCLFTSLVKYTFLPIFLALSLYFGIVIFIHYKKDRTHFRASIIESYKRISKPAKLLLACLLIINLGLFAENYGYNVVKYKNITPDCSQLLSIQSCQQYGPWKRNYDIAQSKNQFPSKNILQFTSAWSHTMLYGLFFAINGINSGFLAKPPLPLPESAAVIIGVMGVLALLVYRKEIFSGNYAAQLLVLVIALYVATLWAQNYIDFRRLGIAVAVQGRYLIPILLIIYMLIGFAFRELLRKKYLFKPALTVLAIFLFLEGGGVMTFIIRNDPTWYRDSPAVSKVNLTAQKVLRPVVPGSKIN